MDYHDIFTSCKIGDLEKVKYLVEARDVELNVKDKWDTTPLYYACLCGHEQVVEYLLKNGAKCEANTFDGERCIYAALNDAIKRMLKNYHMITANTMRRDAFDEFLRRLMSDSQFSDAMFKVQGERFHIHRSIFAARCPQLHSKLKLRLDRQRAIAIKDPKVEAAAFQLLVTYVYTGRMDVPHEHLPTVTLLARHFGLDYLESQLTRKLREKKSFECSKPGVHVDLLSIESRQDVKRLKADFSKLADQAVPDDLNYPLLEEMPFPPNNQLIYPDLCVVVDHHRFMCHKAFFCTRSDYFKAMLSDHFDENRGNEQVSVIRLNDVSVGVFVCILYYIYTGSCQLDNETVFEVLQKADMYLLYGLKRLCSSHMSNLIDRENVFHVLTLSRLFSLPKAEDQCIKFIAANIDEVVKRQELADTILQDAHSIQERQESDSIDIIDSIRYHLTSHVQMYSEIEEANIGLALIDRLLESLGLDC